MRRKLIRRLLVLATLLLTVGFGAGGFYAYRKAVIRRQYAGYKHAGFVATPNGDDPKGIELLERYLLRYPDDIEALIEYARVRPRVALPKNQHLAATIYALRHLLKLDHSSARVAQKKQLLELYVRLHYWAEVQSLCDELLPPGLPATAEDSEVLAARTRSYIAQHDWAAALGPAVRWSTLAPADLQAQLIVLDLVHQTHDFSRFPNLSHGGKAAFETDLSDWLAGKAASATDDPRKLVIRGHGQLLAGRIEPAIASFREAAASTSLSPETAAALIDEFDAAGDANESIPVLKRLVEQSNDPVSRNALIRRSWETGDWKTVAELTRDLKSTDPGEDAELLGLRAWALQRLGRGADAAQIRKALARRSNDPVATAWAFIGGGSPDALRAVALCTPGAESSAYLGYFLADAQARLGESEAAILNLQKSTDLNLTWAAPAIRLSELLTDAGRYEPALEAGCKAVRRQPTYPAILAMYRAWDLCIQRNLAGNPDQLLAGLDSLRGKVKDDGALACIRVDVLAATGSTSAAATAIRASLVSEDCSVSENSLLQLAATSRKYKLGLEADCLWLSESRFGVTPRLAYSRVMNGLPQAGSAAVKVFDDLRARAADPRSTAWLTTRARLLDSLQNPQAKSQIIELADAHPDDLNVQMLALDAHATRDDREFAERTIQQVRRLTGESALAWQLARARWLLAFEPSPANCSEAQRRLVSVVRVAPGNAEAHVLLSRCAERVGRLGEAVGQMRIATGLLPNSPAIGVSLARLLEDQGDFDAAREELSRVRLLPTSDPDQRRIAAVLAAQAGDMDLALALAQDASDRSAAAPGGHGLILAQLYWRDGKFDQALQVCEKLLASPTLPVVQLAADLYGSHGRTEDASRVLKNLDALKLEPGVKELALADFAAQHAGSAAALDHLKRAAAEAPANPQVWKALAFFYTLAGHPSDAQAAVKRGLDHLPADPLLTAIGRESRRLDLADAVADLRPFAVAFVRNPLDPAAHDALLRLTNDSEVHVPPAHRVDVARAVAEGHPHFMPAWMYLVQCELTASQTEDALSDAFRTSRQFPASPEPQAQYVALLRAQGRWQEVLAEARRWRERSLSDPLAADIQIAEADLKLKRAADALRQLDPYVRNAATAPQEYNAVLPLYAQARQQAGQSGHAALLEPLLQQGARGRQEWIAFAVENLDPSEAAAWLHRVGPLIPPDSVREQSYLAQAWTTVAQAHQYAPAYDEALAILRRLASRSDAEPTTVLALGMTEEASGNAEQAQSAYRREIQLNPDDFVARNNLAMLLARSGKNLPEAETIACVAVRLHPDVASLYDTLAFVQNRMHRFDTAADNARTAVRLRPNDLQYRLTLLRVLVDSGRKQEAIKVLGELDALHVNVAALSASVRQQLDSIRESLKVASAQAG